MSSIASFPMNSPSYKLYQMAYGLIERCPPALGEECALVGSPTRGLATEESDLDVNLWVEVLPPLETRLSWLAAEGVTDLQVLPPRPDDSHWLDGVYQGREIEVGWHTFAAMDAFVERLSVGKIDNLRDTLVARVLVHGLPLRTTGRIEAWQTQLRHYSDAAQRRVIELVLADWQEEAWFSKRLSASDAALESYLRTDLEYVFHVIFALNRLWMPKFKWIQVDLPMLTNVPEGWEHLQAILQGESAITLTQTLDLVRATLRLISSTSHYDNKIATIARALDQQF